MLSVLQNTRLTISGHADLGIEIEFNSVNQNGYIEGKRVYDFNRMNKIDGNGKIFVDVLWNKSIQTYVGCVCFEYSDYCNGEETKMQMNSLHNKNDFEHLYFGGDYFINSRHVGEFEIVCISMRSRSINQIKSTLSEYHEQSDGDNDVVPYVECINYSAHKINALYETRV